MPARLAKRFFCGTVLGLLDNKMKRRDFFRLLGGGILILFQPWNVLDIMALPAEQARTLTKDYNAFLHIAEDGTVTCYTGKIEMGQGIFWIVSSKT